MKKLSLTCLGLSLVLGVSSAMAGAPSTGDTYHSCPTYSNKFNVGDTHTDNGIKWVFQVQGHTTGTSFDLDYGKGDKGCSYHKQWTSRTLHCDGTFTHDGKSYSFTARGYHTYKQCDWDSGKNHFQCSNS